MSDKSHVSMEQKICPVCGVKFETDALLLDTRIRTVKDRTGHRRRELMQSMDRYTVTGWKLCDEHQAQSDDGFLHLVEIDPDKSSGKGVDEVHRTGNLAALKRDVARNLFDIDVGDHPMVFIEPGVIEILKSMQTEES